MPDLGRAPNRDPSKRNSITDRLVGSFNQVRSNTSASLQRRASSANQASRPASSSSSSPVPRIRDWLDTCNREHEHHCGVGSSSSPSKSRDRNKDRGRDRGDRDGDRDGDGDKVKDVTTFRPAWLVDAAQRCLVRTEPNDRYLALSYVWGPRGGGGAGAVSHRRNSVDGPQTVQLMRSNLEEFQDRLPDTDIPQTISDAIWLARKLGLRYLWVDRLCIVQDDEAEMDSHVRHMAYVFANAYLTIVAGHGDVHTGLLPLDPRRSVGSPPAAGGRGGLRPGNGGGNHDGLLRNSSWAKRGWTLEEAAYSRRRVYFFEDAVTWECHCERWPVAASSMGASGMMKAIRGGGAGGSSHGPGAKLCGGVPPSSGAFAYRHASWPDLDDFARLAQEYSARRLTLVDDTLRAFSGITHVLSQVFPGGFLYGMPLMFLDIALLWRPQASIRRRIVTRPPFLPSWSWMGWWFDGVPVDLQLWRAAADFVEETRLASSSMGGRRGADGVAVTKRYQSPNSFKIRPTIQWSLTDRQATVPVQANGLQFRELRSRKASGAPLPPGWSRVGKHGFRHDSDGQTIFKYPIPVEDPPEEGEYAPAAGEAAFPGPYLSFRTMSAFFEVEYDAELGPPDSMNPPVAVGNILVKAGRQIRWAGRFRAHDGWLGVQSSNYDGDEMIEFVAISTATEHRGSHVFTEEQFNANKDEDGFLDIVNVLWIERISGVAYRRGLGHILQKAWDEQTKDEVPVLLG